MTLPDTCLGAVASGSDASIGSAISGSDSISPAPCHNEAGRADGSARVRGAVPKRRKWKSAFGKWPSPMASATPDAGADILLRRIHHRIELLPAQQEAQLSGG